MRKLVLGLAMVVTVMGLVGCGTTDDKKDGFVPEQVTESEVVTDDVKEDIEEIADGDLTKYYDVEKYVGTPSLVTMRVMKSDGAITELSGSNGDFGYYFTIEANEDLELLKKYNCIICDNGTPDYYSDDVLAYIFTTPID